MGYRAEMVEIDYSSAMELQRNPFLSVLSVVDAIKAALPKGSQLYTVDGLTFRQSVSTGKYYFTYLHPSLPEMLVIPEPTRKLSFLSGWPLKAVLEPLHAQGVTV